MSVSRICLDMDGVQADFPSAAYNICGKEYIESEYPKGIKDALAVARGEMSEEQFWRDFQDDGTFGMRRWSELQPYPWQQELFELCHLTAPVTIATKPSKCLGCESGKRIWIEKHIGSEFSSIMMGPDKHLMAKSGVVLIDDREENCREFAKHGGLAILFPQPWNRNHHLISGRLDHIREKLVEYSHAKAGKKQREAWRARTGVSPVKGLGS